MFRHRSSERDPRRGVPRLDSTTWCTFSRIEPTILRPGKNQWDHDAVYKPYAIFDGKQWLLWYNGRKGGVEQIGLALHEGEDLGF